MTATKTTHRQGVRPRGGKPRNYICQSFAIDTCQEVGPPNGQLELVEDNDAAAKSRLVSTASIIPYSLASSALMM